MLPVANLDDPVTTMWISHSLSVSVNATNVLNVDKVSVSVTKSSLHVDLLQKPFRRSVEVSSAPRIPYRSSPLRITTRPAASECCPGADPGFPGVEGWVGGVNFAKMS